MQDNNYDLSLWHDDVGDDLDVPHYDGLQTRVTCNVDDQREEEYNE